MLYSKPMKRFSLPGLVLVIAFIFSGVAVAQYTSPNYKSNEVIFGTGGDNNQSSPNYKAQASAGLLGVGRYFSTNYQIYSGFLSSVDPFLELQIDTVSPVNMGNLTTTTTATASAQFHVRSYTDSGYSVQTAGPGLTYTSGSQSHTLTYMTGTSTTVNTEQFGINLRANTSPASFGSDPSPQPSQAFATANKIANGVAAPGYEAPNQYRYAVGATIACSGNTVSNVSTCGGVSGWGLTIFTISYVANINSLTPAGSYSMTQDLVVVATY